MKEVGVLTLRSPPTARSGLQFCATVTLSAPSSAASERSGLSRSHTVPAGAFALGSKRYSVPSALRGACLSVSKCKNTEICSLAEASLSVPSALGSPFFGVSQRNCLPNPIYLVC